MKRYTISGPITDSFVNNLPYMNKSLTTLKYAPPVLNYQQSGKSTIPANTGVKGHKYSNSNLNISNKN